MLFGRAKAAPKKYKVFINTFGNCPFFPVAHTFQMRAFFHATERRRSAAAKVGYARFIAAQPSPRRRSTK